MKKIWKVINNFVKSNPWNAVLIMGFVSCNITGIIMLIIMPNISEKFINWLLFPLSAGSFAAIVNWLIAVYRERTQLDIFLPDDGSFFFKCVDEDLYKVSPNRLVVYIRVCNLSPVPNSLVQFDLEIPKYKTLHSPKHVQPLDRYKFTKKSSHSREEGVIIPLKDNLIKPIAVLSPYHSIEGYLFFPMCPDIKENEVMTDLIITTTRGVIKLKVLVKNINFVSTDIV